MPILSKDGKIIINKGKILTNFPDKEQYITEAETALQNSRTNADEIEKIKAGEVEVGKIRSISIDGEKLNVDDEFNVEIPLPADKIGATKLQYNGATGKLSLLRNDGEELDSVNLPLELMVKSGKYNQATSSIILTLSNGVEINIPVNELIDTYEADESTIHMDMNNKFSLHTDWIRKINNKLDKRELDEFAKKDDISDMYQKKLVSGGNIKTINGQTILGGGNLEITGSGEIDPEETTYTRTLGTYSDCKWFRIAKVLDRESTSYAQFIINFYEKNGSERILLSNSVFKTVWGVDNKGNYFSDVFPLQQKNAINTHNNSSGDYGLISVKFEDSEEGVYLIGLFNQPMISSTSNISYEIDYTVRNILNFEVLETLKEMSYALDNGEVVFNTAMIITPVEKVKFKAYMDYNYYKNIIPGSNGSSLYVKNSDTDIIFGFMNNGTNLIYTFCNNTEATTQVPISINTIFKPKVVVKKQDITMSIDVEVDTDVAYTTLGEGQHILNVYYDDDRQEVVIKLNNSELETQDELSEYGLTIKDIDNLVEWTSGDSAACYIIVTTEPESELYDVTGLTGGKFLEKFSDKYINQVAAEYATIRFTKMSGTFYVEDVKVAFVLYKNNEIILSVNAGETGSIYLDLVEEDILMVSGAGTYVLKFEPYVPKDYGVNVISFEIKNSFSQSSTPGDFENTFSQNNEEFAVYYIAGLESNFTESFDLYNLNDKFNEYQPKLTKGNGIIIDINNIISIDENYLKSIIENFITNNN